MLTLGEELLLVALDADKGVLRGSAMMQIGLNAAGLAELLAAGAVRLRQAGGSPGVTVVEGGEELIGGDPLLGKVLRQARNMREGDRHAERCLKNWVSPSPYTYLDSLRDREVLTWDKPKDAKARYGRIHLLDEQAAAAAFARIDRVADGAGPSERDLDFAGIVHGLGLDKDLYKGRRSRSRREGLATALDRQRFSVLVAHVLPEAPPGQKFTFDSSRDLKMATEMIRAWERTP